MQIKVELSQDSIDKVIQKLERYKSGLLEKEQILREEIAKVLESHAQSGFDSAIVSDLLNGRTEKANVTVSHTSSGNTTVVIAKGEDAVWVEFGAGVYHNGSVGQSPHEKGNELGMTIGSYGHGLGRRDVWGYMDGGELILTHGTPMQSPMYEALMVVCSELPKIVKGVYG
jgi:hypothetical protein|nr:MAG TPA: hypothetical protein [Caudoviricetes sp.]